MPTTKTQRPSTSAQRQYIYKLVGYDTDTKEEAVQWVTNDNSKTSTKDLTYEQADKLIKQLSGATERSRSERPKVHPFGAFDYNNPRHRKILSLAITYGWKKTNPKTGKDIANVEQLGNWLQNDDKAPVHKPLKKMDNNELSKTVYALEKLVKWKYK